MLNSFRSLKFGLVAALLACSGMLPRSSAVAGDGGVIFTNTGTDLEYRRVKAPNWQRISDLRTAHPLGGDGLFVGDLPGVPSPKEHPLIGLLPELVPGRFHGINGVAVFDYDNDGDLDMYVTNGPAPTDPALAAVSPSSANALLVNQYIETNEVSFVDKAVEAGVDVPSHDGYGTCYGDMDNDGDEDLIVTGNGVENLFFVNNGNGTFTKANTHGLEGKGNFAVFARPSNLDDINDPDPEGRYFPPNGPELLISKEDNHVHLNSTGCGTGDFNGDGYLDVVVINSWDQGKDFAPCFRPWLFDEVQHNQLFLNNGNNTFTDVSETSGVQVLNGIVDAAGNPITGVAGITWGLGIADVDQDGDLDMLFADDQCEIFPVEHGGPLDRGFIHVMLNDGNANFTDAPIKDRAESSSTWMSIAFGDYNCDGHIDFLASSFGDYAFNHIGVPNDPGDHSSRWFLGNGDGTFNDINLFTESMTDVTGTPFGWGNGTLDYDNDGDQDVLFLGGLDQVLVNQSDNPGALLQNQDCKAEFTADIAAIPFDYRQYNVQGIGVGDLNLDGFPDFVTASNYVISDTFIPAGGTIADILIPGINNPVSPDFTGGLGSAFDPFDAFYGAWAPLEAVPGGTLFFWVPDAAENPAIGQQYDFGRLTVELNSADNGNNWIAVDTLGSVGVVKNAVMNRDGIGATVKVTPKHGKTVIRPVHVGNYTSAHAKEGTFGLGNAKRAAVEVQWTGGVRNKLFGVKRGERITFPEIPCDFAGQWEDEDDFEECVEEALDELRTANVLTKKEAKRFEKSMRAAFDEFNEEDDDDDEGDDDDGDDDD